MVKHLSISDENYHLAIQMLKEELLGIKYIIDETYETILKGVGNRKIHIFKELTPHSRTYELHS